MDKITLAARIAEEDGGFLATVDNIPLTGSRVHGRRGPGRPD